MPRRSKLSPKLAARAAELGLVVEVIVYGKDDRVAWVRDAATGKDIGNFVFATRKHRLDGCPPANSWSCRRVIRECGGLAAARAKLRSGG